MILAFTGINPSMIFRSSSGRSNNVLDFSSKNMLSKSCNASSTGQTTTSAPESLSRLVFFGLFDMENSGDAELFLGILGSCHVHLVIIGCQDQKVGVREICYFQDSGARTVTINDGSIELVRDLLTSHLALLDNSQFVLALVG